MASNCCAVTCAGPSWQRPAILAGCLQLRDDETGVLFPAGDPAALARAVLDLLADVDRCRAIRTAARRFVEAERTWLQSVDRYAEVYASLLGTLHPRVT